MFQNAFIFVGEFSQS